MPLLASVEQAAHKAAEEGFDPVQQVGAGAGRLVKLGIEPIMPAWTLVQTEIHGNSPRRSRIIAFHN